MITVLSSTLRTVDAALAAVEWQRTNPQMPPRLTAQLTIARCALLTERNTLTASITHLPFDILHTIVLFLSVDYFARWSTPQATKSSSKYDQQDNLMPWLPLMHTCTLMRSVFIYSVPGLWSYVDLSWQHQWFKTCVERAGLACISLLACEYRIKIQEEANSAWTMAKRANLQWLVARHATRPLEQEASHLDAVTCIGEDRCCDLMATESPSSRNGRQEDDFWTQIRGQTPLAKLLNVFNVYIPEYIGTWPSLVGLNITGCAYSEGPRSLFRKIAQAAPRLERLGLEDVWCSTIKKEATEPESLLPFLQVLRIREDPIFVAAALHAFALPSTHIELLVGAGRAQEDCLRGLIIERLLHSSSLSARSVPVTVDRAEGREGCINVSFDLQPAAAAPRVTYTSRDLPLAASASILRHFKVLCVQCDAVRMLFAHAADDPAVLASIEHVVIFEGADGLPEFSAWLVRRAAVGRPIRTINFEDTTGYRYHFGPMKVIARDLTS